jgi:cellulose synthase/poly-beta-1,6-N-acetylglucosamine synthase-like glycosyltransferase
LQSNERFLEQFQAFEFTSLVASGAGAAGLGTPILCNGANLAFRRLSWLKSSEELHFDERSGDDIYLLQSIKKHKGVIRFLKSKAAMVETPAKKTWHEFFHQRRRWAGKKAAYKDVPLILTASIVFLTSAMILFSFIYSTIHHGFLLFACYLFLMKWMVDYTFFYTVKEFFDLRKLALRSFIFSMIYPFYIVITAFSSLLKRKNTW